MFYIIIYYSYIVYTMHIQSFYNSYNPFRPVWTTLKSVRTRTGSDQTVDPVMDENGGLSLLSGDV